MSRAFWVIASDGRVVQKTEDEARMLYQAGYAEPVQLVGGDGQWVDADVFGLREKPQPPPAATERRFWVVEPNGVVALKTHAEAKAYYESGYGGLVMPEGANPEVWVTGADAGIVPPPEPAPAPTLVTEPPPQPVVSAAPAVEPSETPWKDPLFHSGFAFIDTETGGLKESVNPLLSVAVVLADEHLNRLDGFALKVKPPEGTVLEVPISEHIGDTGNYRRKVRHYEDVYTGEILPPTQAKGRYIITPAAAETNGFVDVVTTASGLKEWDREPQRVWMRQSLGVARVDEVYVSFLAQFFKARPVPVAHNAKFDQKYVLRYLPNFAGQLHEDWFCTYRALSGLRKSRGESVGKGMCTLGALAKYSNYVNPNPHEALADAETCLEGLRWLKTTGGA